MLTMTRAGRVSSSRSWSSKNKPMTQQAYLESFKPFTVNKSSRLTATDPLSTLPLELLLFTLSFLSAKDLLTTSSLSSLLWELSHDESLWKQLCKQSWSSKRHLPLRLFPFYAYGPLLDKLSVSECKDILKGRGANMPPQLESEDIHVLKSQVTASTPSHAVCGACASKWKASYFAAQIDLHRKVITEQELQLLDWHYIDTWTLHDGGYSDDSESMLNDDDDTSINTHHSNATNNKPQYPIVNFFADGTRGPISGSRPRRCDYIMTADGHVQVGQYPRHVVHRRSDGRWVIQNDWVTYKSI
ncbi:expressed protein [Batrachochytrium dendrobatidis JAM81]|uniref:Expressed protein n=1 Tax=Batrachochytrium dendrobatidis (strain JAM81 / FGSC 10211) TaxID=684364 RepID=F4P402_BATDJ|nr:uncharacterized protein BATDEDRAFT_37036 [Batrachochytrium dendrobatidis JAM81]EGF79715.1 expressed protein [Batrachochytrium dendrobatidis JAM81]KAJ8323312.1 hypothetical protein O5D80_008070 [Batrachochytrium dendrobatidis]KAK5673018.1 hypothetical protein QVD99_000492 [Batrachochytrium dendrobatidis]|eukprot:XP_006679598.1 expressed protein [Batrachochytrium dendrobatidis JAM81]